MFKCSRKKNICKKRIKKPLRRKFVKIEKIKNEKCRCIQIDSVDGLYLTDNFAVTHNSSYLLHLAGKAQKQGFIVWYMDVEGRLKGMNLTGIKELDISEDKFIPVQSTPDKILTSQDFLNSVEKILKTCPKAFVIIDSISALVDEKEYLGGLGTETRGHSAKVVSQFIGLVGQLVSATNSIVAGVVHLIANTSGFGSPVAEKCANRWVFQSDIQLRIKYIDVWKTGSGASEKVIGQIVHWKCNTSALGQPFGLADTYLRFGYGPDELYEIMEFGKACGLLEQAGSWCTLSFLGGNEDILGKNESGEINPVPKFQGQEKVWDYLSENKKAVLLLEQKVSEYSSMLVKSGGAD